MLWALELPLLTDIGLGAGKCLGVRRNFAQIIPNLPEKYFKKSSSCQFGRRVIFKKKKLFMSIRAPLFSNQSMFGAIFAQIFRVTPVLTDNLQSLSSIKHMRLQRKKLMIFFPVDWVLLFKRYGLKKRLQPLSLEWLDQRFPNFFEHDQNLSLVNTLQTTIQASSNRIKILIVWVIFSNTLLSSYLMSTIYSFLKYLRYKQT